MHSVLIRRDHAQLGLGGGKAPALGTVPQRRILHVVRQMNAGGIAVWLMNILRHIDRERYRMDFLVTTEAPCGYGDEIRRSGGRVIPCFGSRRPWQFARSFGKVLREHGPYDVVHSHIYNFSGFVLRLAAQHGIPVRIAQSHTDTRLKEAGRSWLVRSFRRGYFGITQQWLGRHATAGLGVSSLAAEALFGPHWQQDGRIRIVPLGIDFTPFTRHHDRREVRRSLSLPEDAVVVGHVGNHVWHKNHPFLVEILAELVRQERRVWGLLVGHDLAGSAVEEQVRRLGVAERVLIIGARKDVPRLMSSAMDVFLFPSHYEGLGLVLLEAQAAGLPCVLTDGLPQEVDVVPELMRRLPLSAPPAAWAGIVMEAARARPVVQEQALARLLESEFNIANSAKTLMRLYESES